MRGKENAPGGGKLRKDRIEDNPDITCYTERNDKCADDNVWAKDDILCKSLAKFKQCDKTLKQLEHWGFYIKTKQNAKDPSVPSDYVKEVCQSSCTDETEETMRWRRNCNQSHGRWDEGDGVCHCYGGRHWDGNKCSR